jgi:hypothetical protein
MLVQMMQPVWQPRMQPCVQLPVQPLVQSVQLVQSMQLAVQPVTQLHVQSFVQPAVQPATQVHVQLAVHPLMQLFVQVVQLTHEAVHALVQVVQVVQLCVQVVQPVQPSVQPVQPAVQPVQASVHVASSVLVQVPVQVVIEPRVQPALHVADAPVLPERGFRGAWTRRFRVRKGTSDITSNPAAAMTAPPSWPTKSLRVTSGSCGSGSSAGSSVSRSFPVSSGSSSLRIVLPLFYAPGRAAPCVT